MKKSTKLYSILVSLSILSLNCFAQQRGVATCPYAVDLFGSQYSSEKLTNINESYHQQLLVQNPNYDEERMRYEQCLSRYIALNKYTTKTLIKIPVVVHIVYHNFYENISDAQVFSQMDVLNEDFTRSAADTVNTPSAFAPIAANPQIEFCLASRDPSGNATTGIERRYTTDTIFDFTNHVKYFSLGGLDAWDVTRYFNIWVCNTGGVCWGEFPTGTASTTYGIVMNYFYMGSNFTQYGFFPGINAYYNRGELGVHEVGHCLNLRHIWGDDGTACSGSDSCADTPNQQGPSAYCPTFPKFDSCTTSGNGIMFNNFMDYSDDDCYNLFTLNQAARMWAVLSNPPYNALTSSNGCNPPAGINEDNSISTPVFSVISVESGKIIYFRTSQYGTLQIFNSTGKMILKNEVTPESKMVDVTAISNGIYFLRFKNQQTLEVSKIFIGH